MIFKIVNKLIDTQLILNTAPTRGHRLEFHRIATRINYHKDSFFPTAISLWKVLAPEVAELDAPEHFGEELSKCRVPSVMLRL